MTTGKKLPFQTVDKLIQDPVIFGVRSNTVREKFLLVWVTKDKCLQIDKAHKLFKQQTQTISSGADDAANFHINHVTMKRDYRNNFN